MKIPGSRHRRGCEGATSNILSLLWCSIYYVTSYQVRSHAGWEDAEAGCHRMACQHWLVRWKVWIELIEGKLHHLVNFMRKADFLFSVTADMVQGVELSCRTHGKSSMPYTLAASWRQTTKRLKFLGLRSPLRLRECRQKFWIQWTLLVVLLLYTLYTLFTIVGHCSVLVWFPVSLSWYIWFWIAVVRQEGLSRCTVEAGWPVQEELWNIHQLQDWQGQQADWGNPCSWSKLLIGSRRIRRKARNYLGKLWSIEIRNWFDCYVIMWF